MLGANCTLMAQIALTYAIGIGESELLAIRICCEFAHPCFARRERYAWLSGTSGDFAEQAVELST
jgi:hypothetical protein